MPDDARRHHWLSHHKHGQDARGTGESHHFATLAEFALSGAHRQFCRLVAHDGERRNAVGDEDVAVDDRAASDHRVAAENGGSGVNGHIVLDGWMALLAAEELAEGGGERAEGYPLIHLHVVADLCRLADDHA